MIQRRQTVFLLLAFIAVVACMSMQVGSVAYDMDEVRLFNLWLVDGQGHRSLTVWPMFALLMLSALLSLATIFTYRRRKAQAGMCLLGMLLLLAWYVALAVIPQSAGGRLLLSWPSALPAVAIVLVFMARKGVVADEKLVRSLDRIR